MDDEIVRILVATDNHLGYLEKDAVRCLDSFAAFEEILVTAKAKKADFVLLAGDMFHENKPSRHTLHTAMELFRKHCMGDNPVFMEVLNEQAELFSCNGGRVNYEDPFHAVSLPVFAIHGNHDDPSRECGQGNGEALAAMDLLAVSNMVNYFGKQERVDDIEITPILIRKGCTHIALYGLGAVRDERLNRMWNLKRVRFVRPAAGQGRDNYFNIFVLHQNRDYGRGSKNCIHESMIPEWMDLVIWGNEHEAIPRLVESLVGTYRIYQPGSSVSTSYSESESSSHPKSMGLIEIRGGKEFRLKPILLTQVRPFVYSEIVLSQDPNLDKQDPKIEESIKTVLSAKVYDMIAEARELSDKVGNVIAEMPEGQFSLREPNLVLTRLRVEHSGFPTVNPQRFGGQFVGKVANPSDILIFAKQKRESARTEGKVGATGPSELQQLIREGEEDEINKIKIDELVSDMLQNGHKQLNLLPDSEMSRALEDFVVRRYPNAIQDTVEEALEHMQSELFKDPETANAAKEGAGAHDTIKDAALRVKQKLDDDIRKGKKHLGSASSSNRRPVYSDDEEEEPATAGKKTARGGTSGGRGGGKKKASVARDDDDEQSDEQEDEEVEKGAKRSSGGRGGTRAAPAGRGGRGRGRGGGGTASKKGGRGKSVADEAEDEEPEPMKKTATGRQPRRAAATKKKYADAMLSDEEEEVEEYEEDAEEAFSPEEEETASSSSRSKASRRGTGVKSKNGRGSGKKQSGFEDENDSGEENVRAKPGQRGSGSSNGRPTSARDNNAEIMDLVEGSDDDNYGPSSSLRTSTQRRGKNATALNDFPSDSITTTGRSASNTQASITLPTNSKKRAQATPSIPVKPTVKQSLLTGWE